MPMVTSVKELDIPTKNKLDMDYLGNNALILTVINTQFPRP